MIATTLFTTGATAILAGTLILCWPAALIVAGAGLMAAGVLRERAA